MTTLCILRTLANRTLKLQDSLQEAGVGAWTPTMMQHKRRSRSDKFSDVKLPMAVGYVFAPADDVAQLLSIQHAALSDHPPFVVLLQGGRPALIDDAELDELRRHEVLALEQWRAEVAAQAAEALERARKKKSRRKQRGKARAYVLGQRVRVVDTAWSSMEAKVVETHRNGRMVIDFGNGMLTLEVDACDLTPVHVTASAPEQARAA